MELTKEIQDKVWQRQNCMCGSCGKKLDHIENEVAYNYHELKSVNQESSDSSGNCIMLCHQCYNTIKASKGEQPVLRKYDFQFGNFEDYSPDQQYEDFNFDVMEVYSKTENPENLKDLHFQLKDLLQTLKGLKIEKSKEEEIFAQIKTGFDNLNKIRADKKELLQKEYQENLPQIREIVEKAVAFADEAKIFNDARKILIDAQNGLKNTKINQNDRNELFEMLTGSFEKLNKKQIEMKESYEMECIENYHNIKNKIDSALEFIETSKSFGKSRKVLIQAQGHFKGLTLQREQREEQYARVQTAFEELNTKQDAEREEFVKICNENYEQIAPEAEEIIKSSFEATFFKEARENLISLQNKLKGMKLLRQQNEDLFGKIRAAFEDLNIRQNKEREEFEKESSENYKLLRTIVDEGILFSKDATFFKEARETLINSQNDIKGKKLKKDQRDELFTDIRVAFNDLNDRERKERKSYEKDTENNYKLLRVNVKSALNFSYLTEEFPQARQNLISLQGTIKGMKLKRHHRDELFSDIRVCFEDLNYRSERDRDKFDAESKDNYPIMKEKVSKACQDAKDLDDFKLIRENLIALQNELKIIKLKRSHRNEMFDQIREAFNSFDSRQSDRRETFWQEKNEKMVLLLSNLKERLERLTESLERDQELCDFQKEKLENLVKDGNQELVKQTQDRMRSIQKRIDDKTTSSNEIKKRIGDIQKDLKIA